MLFFRVCWEQGVQRAVVLALSTLKGRWGVAPVLQAVTEKFPPKAASNAFAWLPLLKRRPLVSVVMPVYNSRWLGEAVASVLAQSYQPFELILVDDGSTLPETLTALEQAGREARVRVLRNPRNLGISGATNAGIEASRGEYVAFMDHDDLLHPDALALFARTLNDTREFDVFYTDETIIVDDGSIAGHMQKCPISLDLLLSCNAVVHFVVMRKDALLRIGLLNTEYDAAQDHDLMIRALEHGLRFHHLPMCLYGWRQHAASTSQDIRAHGRDAQPTLPKSYLNGKKAIQAYLDRNGIRATVTDDAFYWFRVQYARPEPPEEVALIVPFKDHVDYLQRLLTSMEKTAYPRYALYLVDNRSERPETRAYLEALKRRGDPRLHVLEFDEPFNYSRLHNRVVEQVPNELLLFMNNDMEISRPDWLDALVEHIGRERVGAVGCRLLRGNGLLQHAGMIYRPNVYYCVMNVGYEDGYFTKVQREVSGVTAACMLIRKSVFQQVGGFDEVQFPIGFSDADLCLKLIRAGYKIIYTPFAELIHHESVSRKTQEESYEKFTLLSRYIGDTPLWDRHYKPTC